MDTSGLLENSRVRDSMDAANEALEALHDEDPSWMTSDDFTPPNHSEPFCGAQLLDGLIQIQNVQAQGAYGQGYRGMILNEDGIDAGYKPVFVKFLYSAGQIKGHLRTRLPEERTAGDRREWAQLFQEQLRKWVGDARKELEVFRGNHLARIEYHPNVLRVALCYGTISLPPREVDGETLGPVERNGFFFLTPEYCPKGTLRDLLCETSREGVAFKSFPLALAKKIFHQIVAGVNHLHQHGIAHRDLKSDNIVFDESYTPKITDFGLAKWARPDDPELVVTAGTVLGANQFRAPEMGRPEGYNAIGQDSWSLAILLFHMVFLETVGRSYNFDFIPNATEHWRIDGSNRDVHGVPLNEGFWGLLKSDHNVLTLEEEQQTAEAQGHLEALLEIFPQHSVYFSRTDGQAISSGLHQWADLLRTLPPPTVYVTQEFKSFLNGALDLNPEYRLTPNSMLQHPWLDPHQTPLMGDAEYLQAMTDRCSFDGQRGVVYPKAIPSYIPIMPDEDGSPYTIYNAVTEALKSALEPRGGGDGYVHVAYSQGQDVPRGFDVMLAIQHIDSKCAVFEEICCIFSITLEQPPTQEGEAEETNPDEEDGDYDDDDDRGLTLRVTWRNGVADERLFQEFVRGLFHQMDSLF